MPVPVSDGCEGVPEKECLGSDVLPLEATIRRLGVHRAARGYSLDMCCTRDFTLAEVLDNLCPRYHLNDGRESGRRKLESSGLASHISRRFYHFITPH